MADLEKVIRGLESCLNGNDCKNCPYKEGYDPCLDCIDMTRKDAIELLKEQQEKIEKARMWLKADGVDLDAMCDKLN